MIGIPGIAGGLTFCVGVSSSDDNDLDSAFRVTVFDGETW